MIQILVCARSLDEASVWASEHGVTSQCVYVDRAAVAEGRRDFAVVRLPGFFERSDADLIDAVIRRSELKRRNSRF